MKKETLIHVKFEYEEALQGKREILSSEVNLLKIAKAIEKYRSLRNEELKTKLKLYKKLKDLNSSINKTKTTLPKLKIPEILQKNKEEKTEIKESPKTKEYDSNLESELKNIQKKLKALQ